MSKGAATVALRARSPRRADKRAVRRATILAATIRILSRDGLAAVTHRAVAREADVPLAATTYYFSSKDELVTEALAILVDEEIARLGARALEMGEALASPGEAAAALAEVLMPDAEVAGALLAKFEVYLEAARRPVLRATAAQWRVAFTDLAESSLRLAGAAEPARLAPIVVAGIDGILVHELSDGRPHAGDVERLRVRLEQLFELVLSD